MSKLLIAVAAALAAVAVTGDRIAARSSPPPAPARTPRTAAPIDLTGNWVSVVTEEWLWRMTTPRKGDYTSIPLSEEGRRVADSGIRRRTARARPTAPAG